MKAALIAAVVALTALPAAAQNFAKPEDAIKYRKAAFTVLAGNFGTLGAMANNRMPFDAKAAADAGAAIEVVARLPWAGFGPGTDKGETRAKPEIWTQQAKYKEASDKMQAEVVKLAAAAKTGNLDQIKATFTVAAGTCKACHDAFRKD